MRWPPVDAAAAEWHSIVNNRLVVVGTELPGTPAERTLAQLRGRHGRCEVKERISSGVAMSGPGSWQAALQRIYGSLQGRKGSGLGWVGCGDLGARYREPCSAASAFSWPPQQPPWRPPAPQTRPAATPPTHTPPVSRSAGHRRAGEEGADGPGGQAAAAAVHGHRHARQHGVARRRRLRRGSGRGGLRRLRRELRDAMGRPAFHRC